MPAPKVSITDTVRVPTNSAGDWTGAPSISAPKIEEDATEVYSSVRAIQTLEQIYAICEAMFNPDSTRNYVNGLISNQYNDCPPFKLDEHKQKGQKFRHNYSTCFLSGILNQAIGQPVRMINQAQYLTSASLDDKDDPQGTKTEAYRRKFTKLVRSWDNWDSHINNVAQENVVYGYAAVACDDPDDWRPEECRQDNFGVPDNTGQHASKCQFFARRKSFMVHELIGKIVNREAAELAGYRVEDCIKELNECMPEDRSEQSNTMAASSRTFVDLIRDGNAGAAYDPKQRTVDVFILLATEHDGKVSKYMVTQKNRRLLYENEDEFEKVSEVISFYTLEPGSTTLYSSKGGGRKLRNIAASQERGRNKSSDSCYLGGMFWLKTAKGMTAVQMKVFDQFGILGSEAEIQKDGFPTNIEAWDRMDERLTAYAEQAFGAYIPRKPPEPGSTKGDKKTATEVTEESQREQLARAEWLERFFIQFGDEMSIIARRAGDPDTKDPEAKAWQKDLEENDGITPELLEKLVNQPQGQVLQDLSQQLTAKLTQAMPMIMMSPFFDKYKATRELSMRTLGRELTERLMFKHGIDPNDELKQIREQIKEIAGIKSGESMPVADDDNHKIHSGYVLSDMKRGEPKMMQGAAQGNIPPQVLDNWQALIKHGDAHVAKWEAQGPQDPDEQKELANHKAQYEDSQQKLDAALLAMKQRQQQQAAGQPQQGAPAGPIGAIGGPGAAPGAAAGAKPGAPPERTYGPMNMSEKVLLAWIAHAKELSVDIRQQLEEISGLKPEKSSSVLPASNGEQPAPAQPARAPEPVPA